VGYPDEYNTWEPEEEVSHLDAYDRYIDLHPGLREAPPGEDSEPESTPRPRRRRNSLSRLRARQHRRASAAGATAA
jgi:hypothetical protein